MNKPIVIFLLLLLVSCSSNDESKALLGKWAGLDDTEYYEMHIDSSYIYVYSLWQGNLPRIRYSMRDDSLYYENLNYSVGFIHLDDSTLYLSAPESSDTLFRMCDSINSFDEVDRNDTIALQKFYNSVYARGMAMYARYGMEFETVDETIWDSIYQFEIEIR